MVKGIFTKVWENFWQVLSGFLENIQVLNTYSMAIHVILHL